jgi:hypothetical protein
MSRSSLDAAHNFSQAERVAFIILQWSKDNMDMILHHHNATDQ